MSVSDIGVAHCSVSNGLTSTALFINSSATDRTTNAVKYMQLLEMAYIVLYIQWSFPLAP